jgi:hypothetical protein
VKSQVKQQISFSASTRAIIMEQAITIAIKIGAWEFAEGSKLANDHSRMDLTDFVSFFKNILINI